MSVTCDRNRLGRYCGAGFRRRFNCRRRYGVQACLLRWRRTCEQGQRGDGGGAACGQKGSAVQAPGFLVRGGAHVTKFPSRCEDKSRGARRVKDDLVVMPKALEEFQGSALVLRHRRRSLQNFGQGSFPVDGAEQPVLERVDGANQIGKCVRPVDQHRDAAGRQTFPNAHRPWQAQWECSRASDRRQR